MRIIKNYEKFKESLQIDLEVIPFTIKESMGIYYENIFKSIGAEEVDIYDTFTLPKDDFRDKLTLDILSDSPDFINSLSSIGLKKSQVQNTEDFETFVTKPSRFLLIHNIESLDIENPKYILFQSWNDSLEKWEDTKLFKVNGDIKNFYDKLSSRVIEIDDGDNKYIYQTSNKNEWTLLNAEKENKYFKKYLRSDEFEELINNKGLKVNII
jgi:hypothetical protein